MRDTKPIYQIMMMENSGAEFDIYGWPNIGTTVYVGFYHYIQNAIDAMHENRCDIRECVYNYGFVLTHKPGLYNPAGSYDRIYFKWDEEKQGFYEAPEPETLGVYSF